MFQAKEFQARRYSFALKRAAESKKPYVIDIIVEEHTDCSMGNSIAAVREFE
jgi:tartronate-semialdehyde synthase